MLSRLALAACAAGLLSVAAIAGCYSPGDLGDMPFKCTADHPECPDNYVCDLRGNANSNKTFQYCIMPCSDSTQCPNGYLCNGDYCTEHTTSLTAEPSRAASRPTERLDPGAADRAVSRPVAAGMRALSPQAASLVQPDAEQPAP